MLLDTIVGGDAVPAEEKDLAADASWLAISLSVNGRDEEFVVSADRRLATLLREDLGLTGTKLGCEVGVCGACTVLVDGRPTSSCITLAVQADGARVETVEGLEVDPRLRELQDAFLEEGGFQCGFCTSGQLMNAAPIVRGERGDLDEDELAEYLHGNLCRCTGYYGILRAIERARA
jgi:aerobic carbon-monoxide dehydrogenase small subunit